ncbi:hypothetical protein [Klebsiella aerogenes]|uniref:hypothetical protein n=1 Tax=Klebsiella aerogenes TaxID=548 RepID=UPI000A854790|nr:hypothetical protein [Klebsiella aerogenes]EKM7512156.1 hypothetical protein [Klebsiella aerogenes]ELW9548583.1 hypothetical protein [Klebsiella aerogenes]HDT6623162.1 hypothetical protein [Klebsiella aerogenes]
MNNEIEFKFGDYAIIEQKRHGVPNEMFVHKVIGQLRSNSWVDVPVQSPATETLHDEMEVVCWCICCGVDEAEVRAYRVNDLQRSNLSPDGGEVTALALTLEKSREASGCPVGVDLQNWVKQLAAESVGLKEALWWLYEVVSSDCVFIPDEKYSSVTNAAHVLLDTPATDRIVAEAEARGVEKFAAEQRGVAERLKKRGGDVVTSSIKFCLNSAEEAEDFAKQLREGADK